MLFTYIKVWFKRRGLRFNDFCTCSNGSYDLLRAKILSIDKQYLPNIDSYDCLDCLRNFILCLV